MPRATQPLRLAKNAGEQGRKRVLLAKRIDVCIDRLFQTLSSSTRELEGLKELTLCSLSPARRSTLDGWRAAISPSVDEVRPPLRALIKCFDREVHRRQLRIFQHFPKRLGQGDESILVPEEIGV